LGNGGNINLESGGAINTTFGSLAGALISNSAFGRGGNITLKAGDRITTGPINTLSFLADGGNVDLRAGAGIKVTTIDTQGGADRAATTGQGGTLVITTPTFFQATNFFTDANGITASISSSGVSAGGWISIRHGEAGDTAFIVGNSSTNGTQQAITTGNKLPEQILAPTRSIPDDYNRGGIQILSSNQSGSPPSSPPGSNRSGNPASDLLAALAFLNGDLLNAPTSIHRNLAGKYTFEWDLPHEPIVQLDLNQFISETEESFEKEYKGYFNSDILSEKVNVETIRNTLKTINAETATHPVIIYAVSLPDHLELVMVIPEGTLIRKVVPAANSTALKKTLAEFRQTVSRPLRSKAYLASAQQLYNWMIAPLEPQLQALGIDTLIFCMDSGLRTIPMAALHDGKQFLIEKYSLGSIPSVSLTNTRYNPVKDAQVLAMGASKFQELPPLPAVPVELDVITQQVWKGKSFLNEGFTLNNLKSQRQAYGIIHLATHADFQAGDSSNSFIQLGDTQLKMNQLRQLRWNQPPQIELLVLSACRTALGDVDAELGFGGLAVQAGVKSALASLWYVSDGGTLALMSEFYRQLSQPDVTIKAEALRRAQIAMLRGQLRLEEGELRGPGFRASIPLPPEVAENQDFSHPYYWAAFMMIGSPW